MGKAVPVILIRIILLTNSWGVRRGTITDGLPWPPALATTLSQGRQRAEHKWWGGFEWIVTPEGASVEGGGSAPDRVLQLDAEDTPWAGDASNTDQGTIALFEGL